MDPITPRVDFEATLPGLYRLDGKVAFLPGGYGGIGEAVAWALALAGATVVVVGRDADKAAELARNLNDAGLAADGLAIDCAEVEAIREGVEAVFSRHKRIDILFNCVGIQREEPLLEVTEAAFDEVYRTNLKSAMFLGQSVAARQIEIGAGGRQVHLLSVRARLGLRARGYSAYCATKGGLVMLVKQHAMELAPHGITVNGIAPTFIYTELIRHVMENDDFRRELLARIPLGRIGDPKDVAGAGLFFCAPASDFVTGQILYVDGGITASQ
ncbi:MAG: SDR family oxidoreductase [Kiloniellales bacterium]|nr:SDR family oxidoreductase [Kiloniellales bacterium]